MLEREMISKLKAETYIISSFKAGMGKTYYV